MEMPGERGRLSSTMALTKQEARCLSSFLISTRLLKLYLLRSKKFLHVCKTGMQIKYLLIISDKEMYFKIIL